MLEIHFLNVGHGDCIIVRFPSGRIAMIDINNSKALDDESFFELAESLGVGYSDALLKRFFRQTIPGMEKYQSKLVDPVDYYKVVFRGERIFRFIASHPDMDHLSGLYRLFFQENIELGFFWDIRHNFTMDHHDWENSPYDRWDWETYKCLRNRPEDWSPKTIFNERNYQGNYWTPDGITILAPTLNLLKLANDRNETNILSYVLMIRYGKTKIVLGGDALEETWQDIYKAYPDEFFDGVTILKASHHGRKSGFYAPIVEIMQPEYTIVSVGKKPSTDASNQYRRYSQNVWSTRHKGTIIAYCDYHGNAIVVPTSDL